MKQYGKIAVCLLLLLTLCACGSYESKVAGVWQGDGSLDSGIAGEIDGPPPFDGAARWEFDGAERAVATVGGRDLEFRYYASDDTLTLTEGGEVSWGVPYELKSDTLRIGNATYTKVK